MEISKLKKAAGIIASLLVIALLPIAAMYLYNMFTPKTTVEAHGEKIEFKILESLGKCTIKTENGKAVILLSNPVAGEESPEGYTWYRALVKIGYSKPLKYVKIRITVINGTISWDYSTQVSFYVITSSNETPGVSFNWIHAEGKSIVIETSIPPTETSYKVYGLKKPPDKCSVQIGGTKSGFILLEFSLLSKNTAFKIEILDFQVKE